METTTSFDLNQAIQQWRDSLGQAPVFRSENLDELESHLRDSIAKLQASGLSAEESLLVAAGRLGRDNTLAVEFGKVNNQAVWFSRILWALIGIQLWNFAGIFTSTLASAAVFSGLNSISYNFDKHGMFLTVTLLTLVNLTVFSGILGLSWWLLKRYRESLRRGLRVALKTHGTFLLTFIAVLVLIGLGAVMTGVTRVIPLRFTNQETMAKFFMCGAYSSSFMAVIKTVFLMALTLSLARKFLRPSQA